MNLPGATEEEHHAAFSVLPADAGVFHSERPEPTERDHQAKTKWRKCDYHTERVVRTLSRVITDRETNCHPGRNVVLVMEAINDAHVFESGLIVVDVAAADDDDTAFAFHTALAAR